VFEYSYEPDCIFRAQLSPSPRQCEVLLAAALDACERYHSAFQFVALNGAGAHEALEAAMFETAGEA
jgi:hypothetical protein